MGEFRVRRADERDAEAILRCLESAFEPYRESYTPEAFADTVLSSSTIGERLAVMVVFVAETESGGVVGTIGCGVNGDEGHLRGMAVLAEWQGRGVAESLLASAEAFLAGEGCRRITLDTTEQLKRAIRFYEKHGYRASGRVADFFGMQLYEYVKLIR
jgi:GNAT superfamily N-acetyltransferase